MTIQNAYSYLFLAMLFVLAILLIFGFVKVIKEKKISDRILGVNMIGTLTITIIAVLGVMIGESYLVDICLIYAAISFISVIVLTKVYIGAHEEARQRKERKRNGMD